MDITLELLAKDPLWCESDAAQGAAAGGGVGDGAAQEEILGGGAKRKYRVLL